MEKPETPCKCWIFRHKFSRLAPGVIRLNGVNTGGKTFFRFALILEVKNFPHSFHRIQTGEFSTGVGNAVEKREIGGQTVEKERGTIPQRIFSENTGFLSGSGSDSPTVPTRKASLFHTHFNKVLKTRQISVKPASVSKKRSQRRISRRISRTSASRAGSFLMRFSAARRLLTTVE